MPSRAERSTFLLFWQVFTCIGPPAAERLIRTAEHAPHNTVRISRCVNDRGFLQRWSPPFRHVWHALCAIVTMYSSGPQHPAAEGVTVAVSQLKNRQVGQTLTALDGDKTSGTSRSPSPVQQSDDSDQDHFSDRETVPLENHNANRDDQACSNGCHCNA